MSKEGDDKNVLKCLNMHNELYIDEEDEEDEDKDSHDMKDSTRCNNYK